MFRSSHFMTKRFPIVLAILLGVLLTPDAARAQEEAPDQIWLSGYMRWQEGEELQQQGHLKAALAKYRFAASVMEQVQERFSDWKPKVVQFRKQEIQKAIAAIEKQIGDEAAIPAPVQSNLPGGILVPIPAPVQSVDPSDPFEQIKQKIKEAQGEAEKARQELRQAQQENDKLKGQLEDAARQADNVRKQRETAEELWLQQIEAHKKEAAKAKEQVNRAAGVEADLRERIAGLEQQLQESPAGDNLKLQTQIKDLLAALDDAKADRDVAEEQMSLISRRTVKIAEERDLASAQLVGVERQLVAMMSERDQAQTQLAALQEEGEVNKALIADLQKQFEAAAANEDKKLAQENELLRGIVLRELKEQARREQARKLIVEELARLQVESQTLTEQVTLLSEPSVKLTASETTLLEGPQLEITESAPDAIEIELTVPAATPTPAPRKK